MIEDNTYEENVKDFDRMFFKLNDREFNWDTHIMIDFIVEKIEAEYAMNCMLDNFNTIHINRFRDVLKWADYQKYACPGGSIPPLSVLEKRKQLAVLSKGSSFFVDRSGRRRRKKYL